MDIKKERKPKKVISNKVVITCSLMAVFLVLLILTLNKNASVARADILVSKVMQGDLEITVKGSGNLRSESVRFISAPSSAVVKEVLVKPGEEVKVGQVIASLENLELAQEVENAEWVLSQAKANYRKTGVNNKMAMLELLDSVAEAKSKIRFAKMELEATELLASKGIVSKISYEKLKENLKQQRRTLEFLEGKQQILSEAHDELLSIANDEVVQRENEYKSIKGRFEQLTVRAQFEGILQSLSVEPGQSLSLGQKIALIGSSNELISVIKIPQNQAQKVSLGDVAQLTNGRDEFTGKVARIAPVVTDNSVEIEINFEDTPPSSVRPQQSVDASIITGTLKNVMYITRPTISRENSTLSLYKLNSQGDIATLTPFRMGSTAGNKIVISGDIKQGQEVVISDLSQLASKQNEELKIY
ncbi:HlyD family secretion protein [Pseudoalteromonas rubra]|uniref:HlyD family secretion protein n=1 Tax=Pseudoalteromonas rubra TaxID=43658 RepID=UPI000F78A0ED|nr:HlyD family efflux transporter periplasmic adaptor subunit [Pseudoalteromonas rubra]